MIWRLFRREPLIALPMLSGFAAAWAAIVPEGMRAPAASALLPFILFMASPGRRSTLFEAALPIPTRSLFIARLLFLLAMVWLPLGIATALLRGQAEVVGAGMVLTAACVFALTARIELFGGHVILYAVVAAVVIVAQEAAGHETLGAGVCLAAAATRLAYVWPRIPASFQAAPVEPRRSQEEREISISLWNLAVMPVLRSALPPIILVFLAIILLQAAIGGWTFALIFGASIPGSARRWSRWLWTLPISRRALLLLTVGPYVACLLAGFLIGAWLRPLRREPTYPLAAYGNSSPVECWTIARGATPPPVVAPWGETVEPRTVHVPGFVAYNPYTVRADNSRRFHDWQFARATEAMFGEAMTPGEYRAADRRELRPLSFQFRGATLIAAFLLAWALFGVCCFTAIEWRPLTELPKPWRFGASVVLSALAFLPGIPGADRVITVLALQLSVLLPETAWAAPATALVIAGTAWLAVERQFATLEPAQQPRAAWMQRSA